jgi:hypothetical protein
MFVEAALCVLVLLIALVPAVRFPFFNRGVLALIGLASVLLVAGGAVLPPKGPVEARETRGGFFGKAFHGLKSRLRARGKMPGLSIRVEHSTWHDSFHRTDDAGRESETVLGKFDGRELSVEWRKVCSRS